MTVLVITGVFFFLFFWKANKDLIEYEILCLAVYLSGFIVVQEFNLILVIYEIFSIAPFIFKCRIQGIYAVFLAAVIVWTGVSIVLYGAAGFAEVFFTRYFFLVAIVLVLSCQKTQFNTRFNANRAFWEVALFDLLFACILLASNQESDSVFVVNHQPVVGNMSICGLLIAGYLIYAKHRKLFNTSEEPQTVPIVLRIILCIILCIASGIRGYIIIAIPLGVFLLISLANSQRGRRATALVSIASLLTLLTIYMISTGSTLMDLLTNLETGIGYRSSENEYFINVLKDGNLANLLFGYGIGSSGQDISLAAVSAVASTLFQEQHLLEATALLNVWAQYFLNVGIVGGLLIIIIYFSTLKTARRNIDDPTLRATVILFIVLYAIMLAFRNSTSCGMTELILVSLLILLNSRNHIKSIDR